MILCLILTVLSCWIFLSMKERDGRHSQVKQKVHTPNIWWRIFGTNLQVQPFRFNSVQMNFYLTLLNLEGCTCRLVPKMSLSGCLKLDERHPFAENNTTHSYLLTHTYSLIRTHSFVLTHTYSLIRTHSFSSGVHESQAQRDGVLFIDLLIW